MKMPVLELRPTQFSVGMEEVRLKVEKIKSLGRKDLEELIEARPVPVVQSRDGSFYIVDRHHFARAAWEAGLDKVKVATRADFTHLAEKEFWEAMEKARFSHLYDQFGLGPHPPSALPENVRGLGRAQGRRLREERPALLRLHLGRPLAQARDDRPRQGRLQGRRRRGPQG